MYRRRILSVAVATLLAGCGWKQDRDPAQSQHEDEQTPDPLTRSEGGESTIEADGEALLLPPEEFERDDGWVTTDGWEQAEVTTTHPCRLFENVKPDTTKECRICVRLFENEQAASEEYESLRDLSTKKQIPKTRTFLERTAVDVPVGDEAVLFAAREDINHPQFDTERLAIRARVVFRDTNAVGTVDYTESTSVRALDHEDVELRDQRAVANLAARMHRRWRES